MASVLKFMSKSRPLPYPASYRHPFRVHRSSHRFFKTHCRDITQHVYSFDSFRPRTMKLHVRTLSAITP